VAFFGMGILASISCHDAGVHSRMFAHVMRRRFTLHARANFRVVMSDNSGSIFLPTELVTAYDETRPERDKRRL